MDFYEEASLVMVPSGYKDQKVYSSVPDDGSGDLTFSRASSATRVGPDGLIEKVRTNVTTYSQDFTNWTKSNVTITTSATANPLDGSLDSQDITPTATLGVHRVLKTNSGGLNSINTWSVYAKAKGYNFLFLVENGNTGSNVSFNLSTGEVGQENSAVGQIESLGSGWYRCSMIVTTTTTPRFDIYVSPTDSLSAYTADGTSGVTLFGAQAETVSDFGPDYIATTTAAVSVGPVANLPRLDYLDSSSPRLLLEPQRTNLVQYSESFNTSSSWSLSRTSAFGSGSVANAVTSPDGYTNAEYIQQATGETDGGGCFQGISYTSGTTYTLSVYATSYIPTLGAAVTRGADAASKTGIDSLIDDNKGTLYMEVTPTNFEGDQRFGVSDSGGTNRIVLRLFNPSNLQLSAVINSSVEISISNSGYTAGNTYKIAGAWEQNNAVIYINGVQVAIDTNCNTSASAPLNRIGFDNGVGTAKFENPVKQALYSYPPFKR
jgi:hypothetical protein